LPQSPPSCIWSGKAVEKVTRSPPPKKKYTSKEIKEDVTPPTRFQEPRSHLIVYAHTPHCDATGSRAAKDSATLLLEVDLVQLIKNNAPWEEEEEKKTKPAGRRRPGGGRERMSGAGPRYPCVGLARRRRQLCITLPLFLHRNLKNNLDWNRRRAATLFSAFFHEIFFRVTDIFAYGEARGSG